MNLLIYIPLMLLALFIGYSSGGFHHTEEVVDIEEIKKNSKKREELFQAMANSVNRHPASVARKGAPAGGARDQEIMSLVDSKDPLQVSLAEMIVMGRRGKNDDLANADLRRKLKADPAKGFKALQNVFNNLSYNDYPVEKAAIMALTLETGVGEPEEIRAMATDTLTKDIAPDRMQPHQATTEKEFNLANSTTDKMFLPSISYEAYLKTSTDATEAMNETVRFLEAQKDHAVRNNIVSNFNEKYPTHDKQLQSLATENNINIMIYKQREEEAAVALKEEQLQKEYQAKMQEQGNKQ